MTIKLFFGILSFIPAFIAYFLYFRNMLSGKTKPHAFSWLIWGILAGIGFVAQASAHAGMGAWATGLTSIASFAIFGFAVFRGTTRPNRLDKVLLGLALTGLALLFVIKNKEAALVVTLIALTTGFVMTIRKAYWRPQEENGTSFALNALKFLPAIGALTTYSFLTVTYPLVATAGNTAVAVVVVLRRRQLLDHSPRHNAQSS